VDDEIESSGVDGKEVRADDVVLGGRDGAVNLMKGILLQRSGMANSDMVMLKSDKEKRRKDRSSRRD
jgi:hypothetical protein